MKHVSVPMAPFGSIRQRKGRKWCSLLLAAGMTLGSLTGLTMGDAEVVKAEEENTPPDKPTDLKTEMLREAYGIDTKNPAFSWVVNDKDADEVQTAYRIVVSKTSELKGDVLDTDWVESSDNSFAHVPELEDVLDDNQLYYWQVQTKDKEGAESPLSDAAPFMTDIASEWESMNGIWAVPGDLEAWKDYTLEAKVSIQSGNALGILMRMDGSNNGYMLQLRDSDNVMKIHPITNKTVETDAGKVQTLNFTEKGITLPTNQSEFNVKLAVTGSTLQVAVDTTGAGNNYRDAGTVTLNTPVVAAGKIGFRTGMNESGTVDDLKITDSDDEVLYESDFSSDDEFFSGCSVSGGKLSVGKSAFSVWADPNLLQELGNITFLRSPKLEIPNTSQIDKAIISAAARGTALDRATIFDLFFNGECIGAGSARELANVGSFSSGSGYTQVYYNSFDVTGLLDEENQNVISAVGSCRDSNRGILIQMTVFYKDGSKRIITNSGKSDSGWKALDGTNAFGDDGTLIEAQNNYMKMVHDNVNMEEYPEGWSTISFDDSKWQTAQVNQPVADSKTGNSGRVLYPAVSENALRYVTSEPEKRVYENSSENIVFDLGKEIIGGLKVNIKSSARQKITVHMGEEMNTDGETVKNTLTASPVYEDFWTLKEGTNAFETITLRTVRYIELIGLDDETKNSLLNNPDSIKGWAIQQEFDESESDFTASGSDGAALLNRLYELSKYSIKATNQDLFVDSQARERAPYEGDLLVNSNTSYAVISNYSLARHSNEWLIDNPTWPNDYSLFSIEMSYWDYIYTGNTDSIQENYEALKKKLTTKVNVEDASTGLILVNNSQAGANALIDWPVDERDGYQGSYYDVVINAEYVGIYRYMAFICDALEKTSDAQYYRKKADKLQSTLIQYAYNSANGCFYDSLAQNYSATQHSSTHATAYALAYGVFDSEEMADAMCDFIYNNCKEEFKGSIYLTYFILKGLYTNDHGEMAQKLMTNPKVGTNVKTFASLLDNLSCTITPEAWGHAYKDNMTLSHPWGASPGCSIVQGMFGILPTKAGFEEFSIKLQPGGIPTASVKAPTVKGPVYVSYINGGEEELKQNELQAEVTIPANSKAVVSLPVNGEEHGSWLLVDGVKTDAEYDGTYLSVALGSGTHSVSVSEEMVDLETHFVLAVSTDTLQLSIGKEAQITTGLTKSDGSEITDAEINYNNLGPEIVTVSNDGVVKGIGIGTAEVEVTATYNGITKTKKLSFTVEAEKVTLTDIELLLSAGNTLSVGDSSQAVLRKVYSNGKKEAVTSGIAYSAEGNAVEVNNTGMVTATQAGRAVLTANVAFGEDMASIASAEDIGFTSAWSFNGTENPLSGTTLNSGRIYAEKSKRVYNTDAGKRGTVVSGSFEIEDVAANIAFDVDGNSFYFWQFRQDGDLKKHKQLNGADPVVMGTTPIALKSGVNTFLIATVGDQIYTWLNNELVDICETQENMPPSGGFGVRNGMSESFYINSISVGSNLTYKAEIEITVAAGKLPYITEVDALDALEVSKGTLFSELDLAQSVKITLSDDSQKEIAVNWSGDYNASVAGEYTLTGTLASGEDYTNKEGKTATIKVVVNDIVAKKASIVSVEQFEDIKAAVGTAFGDLLLPETAKITLSDNTEKTIGVTWEEGNYDASKAGTYSLTGTLAAGDDYTNEKNIQASVNIIVASAEAGKALIASVQTFTNINASAGTAFEQLPLPKTAEITLSDNTKKTIGVTWSKGNYDASKAGTYSLTGTLASGADYENTKGIQAKINVVVAETSTGNPNTGNSNTGNPNSGDNSGNQNSNVKPVVKLNAKSLPLQVKKSTTVLKASGMISGDKVLKWESSKPSIASVNKKTGKITAKKKTGKTVIKVTTQKGATASCTIEVQKGVVKTKKVVVTNVTKKKLTLKRGKSFKLAVEHQPLTATDKISYISSKPSVAKISKSGKITAKKTGKATITVKSANNKKTKITVTVK